MPWEFAWGVAVCLAMSGLSHAQTPPTPGAATAPTTVASAGDSTVPTPHLIVSPMVAKVPLAEVNGAPVPILLAPRHLPYDGGAVPRGYVIESYSFWPLWVGGIGALVGGWALSGMAVGFGADAQFGIPIVGPWLELGKPDGANEFTIASAVGQTLGVAAITAGLLVSRQRLVRADLAVVAFTPILSAQRVGASLRTRW